MTQFQRIVKYLALALAFLLAFGIISSIIGLIGGIIFVSNGVMDSFDDTVITESVTDIDIDISAASLRIVNGDMLSVSTNIKNIDVEVSHSTLKIHQKIKKIPFYSNKRVGEIILTLPNGIEYDEFILNVGAGEIVIDEINAEDVNFDFGAGAISIENLKVSGRARIDAGAGRLDIKNGSINNLDIDLGMGESNICAILTGNADIDCGMGKTHLFLQGDAQDYSVRFSTGIGQSFFNGDVIKGDKTIGNGANTVLINGGIGELNVETG